MNIFRKKNALLRKSVFSTIIEEYFIGPTGPLNNCIGRPSDSGNAVFSRRFRRKSRLLQWLVFFRQFNAIGPLFVH